MDFSFSCIVFENDPLQLGRCPIAAVAATGRRRRNHHYLYHCASDELLRSNCYDRESTAHPGPRLDRGDREQSSSCARDCESACNKYTLQLTSQDVLTSRRALASSLTLGSIWISIGPASKSVCVPPISWKDPTTVTSGDEHRKFPHAATTHECSGID